MVRPTDSLNTPGASSLAGCASSTPSCRATTPWPAPAVHHPNNGFTTDNRPVATGIKVSRRPQRRRYGTPRFTANSSGTAAPRRWKIRPKDRSKTPSRWARTPPPPHLSWGDPEYASRFTAAPSAGGQRRRSRSTTSLRPSPHLSGPAGGEHAFDRYAAGRLWTMPAAAVRDLNILRSVSTRCFEVPRQRRRSQPGLQGDRRSGVKDTRKEARRRLGRGLRVPGRAYLNAFKIPTLHNIAKTAPTCTAASSKTLDEC